MALDPTNTPEGKLPPFEVAKALAFEAAITQIEKHTRKSCWELMGMGKKKFVATQLKVVGGGHPTTRAVSKQWTEAKQDGKWFPGKKPSNQGGRPPQIPQAQKQAIADKAMELKRQMVAPTPEKLRVLLPKASINKATKNFISDDTVYKVFKTMCYDETEDDPWHYLPSVAQDCLTDEMKPKRVNTAKHVLTNITEIQAWNFVAIDPCLSLLPRKQSKADQLKIAAMGNSKWMSKKSKRKGINLRAPKFAKTQRSDCDIVPWTPVFTRGRLKLVVFTQPKAKLNSSVKVAEFLCDRLPAVLDKMKDEWGWTNVPRVILHDKASYFVNSNNNQLNPTFAAGLRAGKFKSWVEDDTKWLASHLGDFYPHESVISHVRRLLSTKFGKSSLYETPRQFAERMLKVERHMNNEMGDGDALQKLGGDLHKRAADLKKLKGERLPN